MKTNPLYVFKDKDSSGIFDVPQTGIVFIREIENIPKVVIKNSNINLDSSSTIDDFLKDGDFSEINFGSDGELEKLVEDGHTGWRLRGRDPLNYGNIGEQAVDFSESVIETENAGATGRNSFAEGKGNLASGDGAHTEGGSNEASGIASHAEGYDTKAYGEMSHAEGGNTIAQGNLSHAEGYNTFAHGDASHAGGFKSQATGDISFSHGLRNQAIGFQSTVIGGQGNVAAGYRSFATGVSNMVGAACRFEDIDFTNKTVDIDIEVWDNLYWDFSVGDQVVIITTDRGSTENIEFYPDEGIVTDIIDITSGGGTIIRKRLTLDIEFTENETYSNAILNKSSDYNTDFNAGFVSGFGNIASSYLTHAEGSGTTASGYTAHTEGHGTIAKNDYMHAEGLYNVGTSADTIHETGIGTRDTDRKNAFEIYTDGKVRAPELTTALIDNPRSLTTKEYVDAQGGGGSGGAVIEITEGSGSGSGNTGWCYAADDRIEKDPIGNKATDFSVVLPWRAT